MGAKIIEKHFTFNKRNSGPDISCSMDDKELKDLIDFTHKVHLSFQKKEEILKEENVTRNFAFHSVVSLKILKKEKNLTMKI